MHGSGAILCVPTRLPGEWEEIAADIVDGWEARWLLIQSAPFRHRAEARLDLLDALAVGLATAAAKGEDDTPVDDDMDVGF